MENDPFVGAFTVSVNGETGGILTITHLGGNTYKIDAGTGADNATKDGNVLEGVSEGVAFKISISGNNLVMELPGVSVDLIRKSNQAPAAASGNLDPRLIGKWSRGSAYVSGDASTASQTVLLLLEDGTYQRQRSFTAGGSDWSTGSSAEPVETGTYSVSNLNQEGGTLTMNGDQYRYYFANSGGDVLMGWGNGKNPWQKIR